MVVPMKYIFVLIDNRKERWNEKSKEKKEIKCKEKAFWWGSN